MKRIRSSILCFVVLLLTAPLLRAQDLSKYRHFTLGMSLTRVLERTDQKMADVKVIHRHAALQEVTWWPLNLPATSFRSDTVEQILFSFYNGELHKPAAKIEIDDQEYLILREEEILGKLSGMAKAASGKK